LGEDRIGYDRNVEPIAIEPSVKVAVAALGFAAIVAAVVFLTFGAGSGATRREDVRVAVPLARTVQ